LRNASRLDVVVDDSCFGCAGGFGAATFAGFSALGFSEVHFGGGGFAGLPQEIRKVTDSSFNPQRKNRFRSLIYATFPAPSWTDVIGQL
jgi:hypothetical protein